MTLPARGAAVSFSAWWWTQENDGVLVYRLVEHDCKVPLYKSVVGIGLRCLILQSSLLVQLPVSLHCMVTLPARGAAVSFSAWGWTQENDGVLVYRLVEHDHKVPLYKSVVGIGLRCLVLQSSLLVQLPVSLHCMVTLPARGAAVSFGAWWWEQENDGLLVCRLVEYDYKVHCIKAWWE